MAERIALAVLFFELFFIFVTLRSSRFRAARRNVFLAFAREWRRVLAGVGLGWLVGNITGAFIIVWLNESGRLLEDGEAMYLGFLYVLAWMAFFVSVFLWEKHRARSS